ncbi:MAG TPA: type II secretion system F family protein [Candidatus Dormibacteraeota bacterium]
MADPLVLAAAGAAGAAISTGVVGAGWRPHRPAAEVWLERRAARASGSSHGLVLPGRAEWRRVFARWTPKLEPHLQRAGWAETPERLVAGAAASSLAGLLAGISTGMTAGPGPGVLLAFVGLLLPPILWWRALLSAGRRRRELLAAEAAPLLELLCLELSAGASLTAALESIASRLDGDLARDLRPLGLGARVGGTGTLEERLNAYAELHQVSALKSLAALCAMSRDYGSGAAQGTRALAADLRREQRRRLIVISRRALNRVLIPSAVGILLPFMAILLFPAVITLFHSFK